MKKGDIEKENAFRKKLFLDLRGLLLETGEGKRKVVYDWLMDLDCSPITSFDVKQCLRYFYGQVKDDQVLTDSDYHYWEALINTSGVLLNPKKWIKNHAVLTDAVRRGYLDIREQVFGARIDSRKK